jgi:hypothetical protein
MIKIYSVCLCKYYRHDNTWLVAATVDVKNKIYVEKDLKYSWWVELVENIH